jgi:hypothetical protein
MMPPIGHLINKRRAAGTCRLFIRIGGVVYGLTRVDRPPSSVEAGWRLSKPDGTTYDVGRTGQGCTCDCPDFAFRRDGLEPEGCKHVKALMTVGLLGG